MTQQPDSSPDDTAADSKEQSGPFLVFVECVAFLVLAVATLLAIQQHFDGPAPGATRSAILQQQERERLIEEAWQARLQQTAAVEAPVVE